MTDPILILRSIVGMHAHLAEGGSLPDPYRAFDDWAADLCQRALDGTAHQHRCDPLCGVVEARPYFGPVTTVNQNPAAHGGMRTTERCECGASRQVNVNGAHREVGPWTEEPSDG